MGPDPRRVRWLAEVNEADLDPKTVLALRTQNALTGLRAAAFERVIGAAYKNIVLGNDFLARFVTTDDDFTAFENFHFNAFVMTVVAACRAVQNGEEPWNDRESIYQIAARVGRQEELVPDQETSIHSPGYLTLRGSLILPAVMSVLFALATAAAADPALDPFQGAGPAQVAVINSSSDSFDPCDVGIDETVREALIIMGHDRWRELCEAATKVSENDGLKPITSVEQRPDGG